MTPEQLKQIMKKLDVDTQELADMMEVNNSTIWRYLNGITKINKFFAKELKNILASCKE